MLQSIALEEGNRMFLLPPFLSINPQVSKFTYSFDKALAEKHISELYNKKSHVKVATLCQLRSEMYKLKKYLARIGAIDTDTCSCRHKSESVNHFLF